MFVKKLASLVFALALVYSISLPARAELLKNFKSDGSIETRSFGIDNEVDRNGTSNDYRGETNYRLLLGGSFDLLDDVHSRIVLGKNALQGSGAGTITSLQGSTFFDNAYVKVDKVFGHVDLTIGRQFYGDPNDLNIYFGPNNDDVLSIASLDVFRADSDIMGWAKFQGIAGKIADTGLTGVGNNTDTDLYGGEVNTDKVIPKGNLGVYYYDAQIKNPASVGKLGNNSLRVAGVRGTGDILAGLGYHAEYIQDFGRNNMAAGTPAYNGDAYFLGLHYGHDMTSGYPIRAKLEYGRGTDRFAAIAPSARFGIIWGEQTTVGPSTLNRGPNGTAASLSNIKVIDAGVGTTCPKTHIGADLNWYRIMYDANLGGVGTSAGNELDLILSYKHSENVYFEVNAARFFVGQALQNTAGTPTNPITRLGADVKIKY
jgi:hypothetical protein